MKKFKVLVPATSANIGAGFDCMGVAVNLFNEMIVEPWHCLQIDTDKKFSNTSDNLVVQSVKYLFDLNRKLMPNFKLTQINNIPCSSGLGSSAACIVGGLMIANQLLDNKYTTQDLIKISTEIEKHPDNVVPAILGGVVNSVMCENGDVVTDYCVPKNIQIAFLTPNFELSTTKARDVLPQMYSRSDLIYNCSRATATFSALKNSDLNRLAKIVGDKIHEPYRKCLISRYDDVVEILLKSGAVATFLSGAGPTIAGFVNPDFELQNTINGWTYRKLDILHTGAKVVLEK